MSGSTRSAGQFDPVPVVQPPEGVLEQLFNGLSGDVLLEHARGRRVLDLGHGAPEVTSWVRRRSARHLSIVEREALERTGQGGALKRYAEESYDLVYCLGVFPHLGESAEQSDALARDLLAEATRVTCPGGLIAVEIANPRSLHGLRAGMRQPLNAVSQRPLVSTRKGELTRWETPGRLRDMCPRSLRVASVHAMGTFVPYTRLLRIPLLGGLIRRFEFWGRDRPLLQYFGRHLLVLLRKESDDDREQAPLPPSSAHESSEPST